MPAGWAAGLVEQMSWESLQWALAVRSQQAHEIWKVVVFSDFGDSLWVCCSCAHGDHCIDFFIDSTGYAFETDGMGIFVLDQIPMFEGFSGIRHHSTIN